MKKKHAYGHMVRRCMCITSLTFYQHAKEDKRINDLPSLVKWITFQHVGQICRFTC